MTASTAYLLLLTSVAAAPAPLAISMQEAVSRTLARHPALQANRHAVAGAEIKADQARTGWLPRVTLQGWYRYSGPTPTLNLDTGLTLPGASTSLVINRELGSAHNGGATVSVGWRAWDFGARDARVDAAEAMARAQEAQGASRTAEVAYAVRASYASALFFEEVAAVTSKALAVAGETLSDAERKKAAGLGADVAIAAASARVAELQARLRSARASAVRSMQTLRLLLGLEPTTALNLTDSLAATARTASVGEARLHPSLLRLDAMSASLKFQRRSLAHQDWPTLDLFAQAGYQFPRTFIEDEAGFTYAAGLTVTWSLFDGDLRRRQRKELDAKQAELVSLRKASQEEVARNLVDALARSESAEGLIAAGTRRLESAAVYLKVARGAKKAGAATALDVHNAEVAVDRAELALLQARFEASMAQAARLRAAGLAHPSSSPPSPAPE